MAADSTYQHRDKRICITFSHCFLVSFVLKEKWYLFSSLRVLHLTWEFSELSLPCYPIWPRLSDHNLEKVLCGGLLEGVMDELQREKAGSFQGMELSCALLARALMRFKSFSEFSPTCSLMLFGKSSHFFPINHLWHIFFPVFKVALSHDRKACTASFSCRSENVWKMYSFEFLICFMQEMCNCGLTSCLINASQAHHQTLSSCFVGFFPPNAFL